MKRVVTAVAISALLGVGCTASPTEAAPSYQGQVVALTNQQRAAHGCGALTENAAIDKAATGHSDEMAEENTLSHDGANGSNAADRLKQAGYPAKKWAENIASGYATPKEVVGSWMNSAGHRANILDCGLAEIGVGYVVDDQGVPYWTQDFATR
jgi:uncharacterized protein YkwD